MVLVLGGFSQDLPPATTAHTFPCEQMPNPDLQEETYAVLSRPSVATLPECALFSSGRELLARFLERTHQSAQRRWFVYGYVDIHNHSIMRKPSTPDKCQLDYARQSADAVFTESPTAESAHHLYNSVQRDTKLGTDKVGQHVCQLRVLRHPERY